MEQLQLQQQNIQVTRDVHVHLATVALKTMNTQIERSKKAFLLMKKFKRQYLFLSQELCGMLG
jgi:hypothetical protein